MSTVHPDPPRLPVRLRNEQEVLRAQRTLPQAHVFARLSILDAETNRDREIDFLVLHPELGLVIVEVKGQGVEPKGDHWIRRQEDGREEILDESPGEQLQAQQWALLRWLWNGSWMMQGLNLRPLTYEAKSLNPATRRASANPNFAGAMDCTLKASVADRILTLSWRRVCGAGRFVTQSRGRVVSRTCAS